jgi:hypothetical protein
MLNAGRSKIEILILHAFRAHAMYFGYGFWSGSHRAHGALTEVTGFLKLLRSYSPRPERSRRVKLLIIQIPLKMHLQKRLCILFNRILRQRIDRVRPHHAKCFFGEIIAHRLL